MAIVKHPTNPEIFAASPDYFGWAISGEFSYSPDDWIVSAAGYEMEFTYKTPQEAFEAAERYLKNTEEDARASARMQQDIEARKQLRKKFATGNGVIRLAPGMQDFEVMALIRNACDWSNGQSFRVLPPQR